MGSRLAPSVGISLSSRAAAARTYFTLPGAVPSWSLWVSDLVCAAVTVGGGVCADFVRGFLSVVQPVNRSACSWASCKAWRLSVRLRQDNDESSPAPDLCFAEAQDRMAAAPRDRCVSGRKRPRRVCLVSGRPAVGCCATLRAVRPGGGACQWLACRWKRVQYCTGQWPACA